MVVGTRIQGVRHAGCPPRPVGTGGSIVCDPEGTVIGDLPTAEPGVLRVALDLDADTRVREHGTEGFNRCGRRWRPMIR